MGALLAYFAIASVIAVPFLAYHLLRTRRDLNALRTELRQRGLLAPAPDQRVVHVGAGAAEGAGDAAAARQITAAGARPEVGAREVVPPARGEADATTGRHRE